MISCPFIDDYKNSIVQKNYIFTNNKWYPLKEIKLFDNCYNDGIVIGSAISKELLIKIEYEKNLKIDEFELHLGTDKGMIKIGDFIVVETREVDNGNSLEILAYDFMIKANKKYNSKLDYSSGLITIDDVLNEVLGITGIKRCTQLTNFANSKFIVDSNQFSEETICRQVFIAIAQISGCIARINSNNEFMLVSLNKKVKEEYILSPRFYNKINKESVNFKINTVSLGSSLIEGENVTKKAPNITTKNEQIINILDNPFAYSQEKRLLLIEELYNELNGFSYTAFETSKQQGLPFLEVGDKIIVKDQQNNIYNSFILKLEYRNGINSYVAAPAIIKSDIKYKVIDKAISQIKHTEIKVDKAKQKINNIVSEISNIESKVTELSMFKNEIKLNVEETIDNLNNIKNNSNTLSMKVDSLINTLKQTGGTNLILNSSGQFKNNNWNCINNKNIKLSSISNVEVKNNFLAKTAFKLHNEEVEQNIDALNGEYTLSFSYKKLLELANCLLKINDKVINLESLEYKEEVISIKVTTNSIKIKLYSDTDNSCILGDIMLVKGNVKQVYTINENESVTTTVKINDKIEINSSTSETSACFGNEGIIIKNANNNLVTSEFTKEGTKTENIVAHKGNIAGIIFQNVNGQIWLS